jgi:hypothetical protein
VPAVVDNVIFEAEIQVATLYLTLLMLMLAPVIEEGKLAPDTSVTVVSEVFTVPLKDAEVVTLAVA